MEIQRCADLPDLNRKAATFFVDTARRAVTARGTFTVALAGGRTPEAFYSMLSQPPFSEESPWTNTNVYFGDERWVPKDKPGNNYLMARRTLLDKVSVPLWMIHPIPTDLPDPAQAAAAYERELREAFPDDDVPRFDLVLLGMGADGHIASLFPRSSALAETERLVVPTEVMLPGSDRPQPRLTITLPVINNARRVAFLVTGQAKADALYETLEGSGSAEDYPAKLVKPRDGELYWFVDDSAASRLQNAAA